MCTTKKKERKEKKRKIRKKDKESGEKEKRKNKKKLVERIRKEEALIEVIGLHTQRDMGAVINPNK